MTRLTYSTKKCRTARKLDELERILDELLSDSECKVIIFSEWVRMLSLVQSLLSDIGVDYALHTGSVPQKRRKAEINRFKEDPDCRIFLSSESGGTGLNLQVANAVVNLDQPLEPRQAGTEDRPRMAKAPEAFGHRREPGQREFYRAQDAFSH